MGVAESLYRGDDMFVRNESFQQFIRYYPVVTVLLAINTFFFILINLPFIGDIIRYLLIGSNMHVAMGEYWRLFTSMILHGSIMHFLFNSFGLFILGPALERILGSWKFIFIYLFAGLTGNVATFMFAPLMYAHLGASGAIYGLLGMYFYMSFARKDIMDPQSSQIVYVFIGIGVLYSFMDGINEFAHFGGLIGGAVLGPVMFMGKMKYFTTHHTYASPSHNDGDIGFDPLRWQKQRKRKKIIKYVVIGALIVFILLGILNTLL